MWIFVEFVQTATLGTVFFAMLLPFALIIGGFVMAFKSEGAMRILYLLLGVGMTLILIFTLAPTIMEEIEEQKYDNPDNITVEISDKENAGDAIFHFPCKITNNFTKEFTHTKMELIITNLSGEVLLKADIPSSACAPGESDEFILEVTVRGNTAEELYYTDFAYLNVSVTVGYVQYPKEGRFLNDERTLHTANATAIEDAYQQAISAYEQGNIQQAWELLCTLGNYKESETYRQLTYDKLYS